MCWSGHTLVVGLFDTPQQTDFYMALIKRNWCMPCLWDLDFSKVCFIEIMDLCRPTIKTTNTCETDINMESDLITFRKSLKLCFLIIAISHFADI